MNEALVRDFINAVKAENKKTSAYDTPATVTRIDGGTAWVHIPGGVDETPIKMTVNAKEGDTVQVRVADGRAWIVGNETAPPTDDAKANEADKKAAEAKYLAVDAVDAALKADIAAQDAVASAETARAAAETAQETAESVEGIAEQAQASAENASEYAARALGNLSTVQNITETLNWITQHGTMALTTDVALDPTHVYFVMDAGGDYVVGGVTYAVVTEPDVADIGTYYELTIDESLNNYVGTHLALTSEGLWLLPASSGTDKVLIATGAGSTYTTAGTYIIDSGGDTVASFRADGATIGINDGTESYLDLDYHSLQLIDKNGNTYFYVSDLRDGDGYAELTETKQGDGSASFSMSCIINSPAGYSPTATVNGSAVTVSNYYSNVIVLASAPAIGSTVVITYKTQSAFAKAYTAGIRNGAADIGAFSCAEGYNTAATDFCSHAEGNDTSAGLYSHAEGVDCVATNTSHAEGFGCEATKNHSHAQNNHTLASSANQTALGKYNKEDNTGTYAVIIGNGTSNNARSDALKVDWTGNVQMALDTTAASGTDHDLYAAITALGWESDVIV